MPSKKNTKTPEPPDFESALMQLQQIVTRMENEQQSLKEAISDYEQGTRLAAICQQQLDSAQLKVEQLVKSKDEVHFEKLNTHEDD